MPGKNLKKPEPKRKGRRARGSSAPVPPSNLSTSTSSSSSTSSKMTTKPSSSLGPSSGAQTRGRRTNNSQKGRGSLPSATSSKPPPVTTAPPSSTSTAGNKKNGGSGSKGGNGSGPGVKAKSKKPPDYSSYTAENQTTYRPGDYAYVDSQQSDQPYHICLIKSFKGTRKDTVTAEVKWFYRVCELPEAVYYQLMEDRKQSEYVSIFELPSIRDREIFAAFNVDTHPAHLFRGKCIVKEFSTIPDMASFLPMENHFFYQHGYKPESRRMTKMDEFSFIPYSQQAELPDYKSLNERQSEKETEKQDGGIVGGEVKKIEKLDRYSATSDQLIQPAAATETLIWKSSINDDSLLMYLRAARSVALHAGVCMQGLVRDGYMAASSDETTQQAFDVLHCNDYDTEKALLELIKKPSVGKLHKKKNWSKEHSLLFAKGMRQFGKNFRKIKNELLPNKEITELIEYYYYWKKTTAGLSSRNTRKQRKQFHIRMSRAMMKPEDKSPEPEREFIDVSSGEEEDLLDEDGEKCFPYHACRHCFSTESNSWHHSGSNKTILCSDCRLYFRKYSCMRPLTVKREPPPFMFKDYHLALAEENRRKTRNSNNVRLPHAGLRNGKIFSKSDSDEDEEGSESSEFSSTESVEVPVSTNKRNRELQQRRSLMDLLDNNKSVANVSGGVVSEGEPALSSETPEKKIKEEKEPQKEGTGSDEDGVGSGPSTVNEQTERDEEEEEEGMEEEEEEEGRKSTEEHQSTSQSPESSGEERPLGPLSATTPKSSVPLSKAFPTQSQTPIPHNPIPQSFTRISKDTESSCARTDLVYVHPSPEERKALAQPQKAIPQHIPHLTFGQSEGPHLPPPAPPPQAAATAANSKQVPTITTYDPHLPSGPGHFIGFPMVPPTLTPTMPPGADPASIVTMATRQFPPPQMAREDLFIWQQQQALAAMATAQMQKQLEGGNGQHIAFQQAPGGTHILSAADHNPQQQQQGMIFQFPSPEEMARLQRSGHTLHSLPDGIIAAHPHHPFHQLVATPTIVMDAGHHHDDGSSSASSHHHHQQPGGHHHHHHQQQQMSLSLLPNNMAANLEALQQQQLLLQQQQQNPQVMAAILNQEHIQDLQRRYMLYMQEYQKNPAIINNPNFQSVVAQYQQFEQYLLLQQQQQQQQELLIQQEMLKHQQKYAQQSSLASSTSSSAAAARPGVIMNSHSSGNRN